MSREDGETGGGERETGDRANAGVYPTTASRSPSRFRPASEAAGYARAVLAKGKCPPRQAALCLPFTCKGRQEGVPREACGERGRRERSATQRKRESLAPLPKGGWLSQRLRLGDRTGRKLDFSPYPPILLFKVETERSRQSIRAKASVYPSASRCSAPPYFALRLKPQGTRGRYLPKASVLRARLRFACPSLARGGKTIPPSLLRNATSL